MIATCKRFLRLAAALFRFLITGSFFIDMAASAVIGQNNRVKHVFSRAWQAASCSIL